MYKCSRIWYNRRRKRRDENAESFTVQVFPATEQKKRRYIKVMDFEKKKNNIATPQERPAFRPDHYGRRQAQKAMTNTGHAATAHDAAACETPDGLVFGRNAVRELLKTDRQIDKILVRKGDREGSIVVLVAQAVERGIPVVEADRDKLDVMSGFAPHQGIIAMTAEKEYVNIEDILAIAKERAEAPLIVIADGITDPYNLGALIRCAEGCGAHGLIIPKRRAVGLTPLVTKASAGALEHMAIARVPNIAAAVRTLQDAGVWVYAAEAGGSCFYEADLTGACALVFGSEGNGVSRVVKEVCDGVISIPMYGKVNSFNVSTAAAVILAEAAKQHRQPR